MEERIAARIAELEQAEQELRTQLGAVMTVIAELRQLLAPKAPVVTGAPLGRDMPAHDDDEERTV